MRYGMCIRRVWCGLEGKIIMKGKNEELYRLSGGGSRAPRGLTASSTLEGREHNGDWGRCILTSNIESESSVSFEI
jgi:hypothetical protein